MLNEEIHAQYSAVDDYDASTNSQVGESSANGEENEDEYGQEEEEQDIEFTKIKRENVFSEIDFTKRKTKIIATIG
jgi:hypothetical protein